MLPDGDALASGAAFFGPTAAWPPVRLSGRRAGVPLNRPPSDAVASGSGGRRKMPSTEALRLYPLSPTPMRRFLSAAAALVALALPAQAQDSLDVPFRFLPDLSGPSGTVAQVFVPGAFNDWGQPYVAATAGARIANTNRSKMAYDAGLNEYRKTIRLRVGSAYQYKVQVQRDALESSTNFFWAADPLNPVVVAPDGNSQITVADPMVFQLAREQEGGGAVVAVSATIAGTQAITALTFEVNGVVRDGLASFNAAERLFRYVLPLPVGPGSQFKVTATDALGRTATATVGTIPPTVTKEARPVGLEDGITPVAGDPTRVRLSLFAPQKAYVYVLGDFNNWTASAPFLMKKDSVRADSVHFWIELSGLTPGREYGFQYFVDGLIRVADPYSPKVLDPFNDSAANLGYTPTPAYPTGKTDGMVGVLQTNAPAFNWTDSGFQRPRPKDLVVYELSLRDFLARHDYKTLTDTLGYLQRLGINAIELMPVSEFDGNLSWGYNPAFHGALDKYYGTPTDFKAFVNAAHARGIAVLVDVVYNHATGQSPLVRLYNTSPTGDPGAAPSATSPYANPTARHPFNVFNDLNHDSPATRYWLDRMNRYWMEEYHLDGYRYDLSKGFSQRQCAGNQGCWDSYDASRIFNLKRMADRVWARDPNALLILEHLSQASEEVELATYRTGEGRPGFLFWRKVMGPYGQALMGYAENSNLASAYFGAGGQGLPVPNAVALLEDHDEQRLVRKAVQYGAVNGSYSTRDAATYTERMKAVGAFFFLQPGPKMIWEWGELGYGALTGECLPEQDACPGGRTDARVSGWPYRASADRMRLYRTWATLIALRKASPTFTDPATTMSFNTAGLVKRITLRNAAGDAVVVGNFGTTDATVDPAFTRTGTWYNVFSGREKTVDNVNAPILLKPGQFAVYTSTFVLYAETGLTATDIERDETAAAPLTTAVEGVWPNPARAGDVRVRYAVPTTGTVRVEVLDVLGRRVATLADAVQTAGAYTATFDAADLAAGTYVVRVTTAQGTATAPFVRTR